MFDSSTIFGFLLILTAISCLPAIWLFTTRPSSGLTDKEIELRQRELDLRRKILEKKFELDIRELELRRQELELRLRLLEDQEGGDKTTV